MDILSGPAQKTSWLFGQRYLIDFRGDRHRATTFPLPVSMTASFPFAPAEKIRWCALSKRQAMGLRRRRRGPAGDGLVGAGIDDGHRIGALDVR